MGTAGCISVVLLMVHCFLSPVQADIGCNAEGFCAGTSIGVSTEDEKADCISKCNANDNCNYWTYDSFDGFCNQLSTCVIDNNCHTCISGESGCPPRPQKDVLLLVGGVGGGVLVEAVDLSSTETTCPSIADYPYYVFSAVGMTYKGVPVVCGDSAPTRDCYMYDHVNNEWDLFYDNMTAARSHAFGAQLAEDEFVIMGGGETSDQSTTDHFLPASETFTDSYTLPFNLTYSCSGMLNETHVFVTGGYSNSLVVTTLLLVYDIPGDSWTIWPNMTTPRYHHACGVAYTDVGPEIVVTGGSPTLNSTEIFNVMIEKWRDGPTLPAGNRGMGNVQYEDTFLLSGGITVSERTKILKYEWETETWFKIPQEFKTIRYAHSAMLVTSDIISCT